MNKLLFLALSDRLKVESCRRIQNGVSFQIIVIFYLSFTYGSVHNQSLYFNPLLVLSFILVAIRGILFRIYIKNSTMLLKLYHFLMFTTLLSALGYGALVFDAITHFHILNSQVIVLLFLTTGMLTAVSSSLAAATIYQHLYFLLIIFPLLLGCFHAGVDSLFNNIGLIYTVYVIYLFFGSRGISEDLISTYKSEIEARQQKETLQKVIDLVPGFVALSDSNGAWKTTSQSFEKYKTSSAFLEIFKQFRLGHSVKFTREMTWIDDNKEQSYILSIQKSPDLSVILVGVPAEEIFEMRRQLDAQRTKAEFSARLATLGEMAGGIAHEVNNPLAVIIGICSQIKTLIEKPEPDIEKIKDKIEKVSKTAFRINKIITGLQSFSRQSDKDPFIQTKLSHLLDDTLELCREKFYKNNIELRISKIPDIELPIRSVQISQVLINLLNNAFDAVKNLENKFVSLDFEVTPTDLFITITDSGLGIPPQVADKIFDPFFTTKDVNEGTGLGLSISRSILLDHKGEIHLLKDKKNTTFKIRLPLQHPSDQHK